MSETWERAKEIFNEVSELPPAEREAFLDRACGGDDKLRAEVESLLDAHSEAGSFLGGFTDAMTEVESPLSEGPGTMVGRYKLLQKIGEGGFGTVYMAEQERPVRRKVALKIIKLGMDTKQVIARFEAERQALALMDHPNIARVLDAGSTETGRPFFVMELVRGVPITKYCDENNLSTRERLELFLGVCGAVQHAHQKGIIHRDIKPSNVMITLHDGTPVPKVIDFGIAKATNQRLTEKTLFTQYHQFIGTPQYMSPEQAEMSGLDVDTRTDIYSMGVLLYELLTGTTPVDPERLRRLAYTEIHRVIRDEDPMRPSTRVSTMGDADTAAKRRATDTRTLRRALSGDLDWIVMKALEKDRTRRYETANGLMLDVRRHLDNEPVTASPPTPVYRIRKFIRRNRTAVTVGATVCVTLLGGLGLATYGFIQANRERAAARQEAESSEQINRFFTGMLASADPLQLYRDSLFNSGGQSTGRGPTAKQVSVKEMLLSGLEGIDDAFTGKPLLEAKARETIGATLLGLGESESAVVQFEHMAALREQVLPGTDREMLRSRLLVAVGNAFASRMVPAEKISQEVLRDAEKEFGPEDPLALSAAVLYASSAGQTAKFALADSVFEVTLERQRRILGPDHRDVLRSLVEWTWLWCWRGNGAMAESLSSEAYERSLATYGRDDPLTISAGSAYTLGLAFLGRDEEAERLARPLLAQAIQLLGEDHPIVQDLRFSLLRSLSWTEDTEEVDALFQKAVQGPENWVTQRDYGNFLLQQERIDEALEVLGRQYEYWSGIDESERVDQARLETIKRQAYRNYRRCLERAGQEGKVSALAASWLEVLRTGSDSGKSGPEAWNNYAWELATIEPRELRDPAAALRYASRAVDADSADRRKLAGYLDTKAKALEADGRIQEALETEKTALELWFGQKDQRKENRLPNLRYWTTQAVRYASALGDDDEGRRLLDRAVGEIERLQDPLEASRTIDNLAGHVRSRGFLDLAEPVRRRALELARTAGDREHLFRVLCLFASLRNGQGAEEETEELLAEAKQLYSEMYVTQPISWEPDMGYAEKGERSRPGVNAKFLLADVLVRCGHLTEAEELIRQARCSNPEGGSPAMAELLWQRGRFDQAEGNYRKWYENSIRNGDPHLWPGSFSQIEASYGLCMARNRKFEEAEKHLLAAHARALEWGGPRSQRVQKISAWIGDLYDAWGKQAMAAQWREDGVGGD